MKKLAILAAMLFCNVAYSTENHDIDSACNYDVVCVELETEAAMRIMEVAADMEERGIPPMMLILCVSGYSGSPSHMMRGIVECAGI